MSWGPTLSRWRRPARQRAYAVGLSAATLILAACSSGGTSAGRSSAGTPLAPRQALLAAAIQARQVTSASETLTVYDNTSGSTTTGTVQVRLKPTLLASENLTVTAAGTTTRIKIILTGTAIYVHEASLAGQLGKPWVKMDLSALSALGSSGASLAQLIQSLQSNSFTNQAQLTAAARNTRVAGTQTVDGATTTEYAGSFTTAAALKALPASLRQALTTELQALGNSPVSFHEWIDGQHHLRKLTEVETVNGDTVNTTINITAINQPVHITVPLAGQTFVLPGSGPVSGNSGSGGPGARTLDELKPGDCLTGSDLGLGTSSPWPDSVMVVRCTQQHIGEVFFAADAWPQSRAYPGDSAVNSQADNRCNAAFTAYDGTVNDDSNFSYDLIDPGADDWASGDRLLVCVAYYPTSQHPGGQPVDYSIKGSQQ